MSQQNVETLRRVAEIWNESGWEGVISRGLIHPEVEYHDDKKWPEARSAFGASALVERFDEVWDGLGKDGKIEVEDILDGDGEELVMIFRFIGAAPASGIPHDYRWGYLLRLRDGQVGYIQAYLDPAEALRATGLSN